jgi:hypothetical protein
MLDSGDDGRRGSGFGKQPIVDGPRAVSGRGNLCQCSDVRQTRLLTHRVVSWTKIEIPRRNIHVSVPRLSWVRAVLFIFSA